MSDNSIVPRAKAQPQKPCKLRWKKTFSGNSSLSFHGLKLTVFQNTRSGWSFSVVQNNGNPVYYNFQHESEARAAAEKYFCELKDSGNFRPPKPLTCRQALDGILQNGRLPREYSDQFVELQAWLERDGDKADLFRFRENGKLYWVPHSQFVLSNSVIHGPSILIVTCWWYDRRVPVLC